MSRANWQGPAWPRLRTASISRGVDDALFATIGTRVGWWGSMTNSLASGVLFTPWNLSPLPDSNRRPLPYHQRAGCCRLSPAAASPCSGPFRSSPPRCRCCSASWSSASATLPCLQTPQALGVSRRISCRPTCRRRACKAADGCPTAAATSTANPRNLTIDLLLDLRDERAPRDLPFCDQESRVRFVPWQLTGTSWTPFEGAIGQAVSMMSTLPWRAAIRHAKMGERAYVRVQRETWLE